MTEKPLDKRDNVIVMPGGFPQFKTTADINIMIGGVERLPVINETTCEDTVAATAMTGMAGLSLSPNLNLFNS
jgi:hypothetical protein